MGELREHRLKRLAMRSMRRGIKEMDIILSRYAAARLETMTEAQLDAYDRLLEENDQDLYQWVSGQIAAPAHVSGLIADIRAQMDTV
ncbi:succinate dehydrogenase assembly factor 2 [Thalassovita sp.]|uniref:succinate dehydrogenase assembly factor 2 n=1 Tax=Thalassovita sp. TaxID=1979401 RepID=UPI002B26E88A|nr:succinate dehydrogenase assembly factor 2 [Thalassovita sp.]